jgi:hypothetical protein
MLKPITGALTCLLITATTYAQDGRMELVRNGGFENLDKSVKTYDQLPAATGWTNVNLGLADVFVPTASPKTVGIPVNDYGTMEPQEGEHYAGFFSWKDDVQRNYDAVDQTDVFKPGWNEYSEYIESELIKRLEKGKEYEIVFHVALSGNSDRTIMGLGAFVSEVPLKYQHRKFLGQVPQVYTEEMLKEKGKWTEVRGTFKADGTETHIILGVFPYVGGESERLIEGHDNQYAYYYIDGISLKEALPPAPEGQTEGQ